MNQFLKFAKRHFAEKLGVSAEDVEKWYDFVNKNFFIYIASSKYISPDKPETFSGQSEFKTPEDALNIALQKVNSVEFTREIHFTVFCDIPFNALILFDTERERKRIMEKDSLFKNRKS